ncbi:MAG: nucleoside 2-deoxyribosyltransferase [Planctomycetes bacterium]|nr:nucleoside 2-deoxyribosyltransferase [Planctomycetota bacterium]
MKIYLAAPLFSQVQRSWNRRLSQAVEELLPRVSFVLPQDFRTEGKFNDPKHYSLLFRKCLGEMSKCDVVLAVLDGSDADSGVSFEMGVAYSVNKPIVGLRTDYRPGAEHGVNIMVAGGCTYMIREFSFQEDLALIAKAVARRLKKIMDDMARNK